MVSTGFWVDCESGLFNSFLPIVMISLTDEALEVVSTLNSVAASMLALREVSSEPLSGLGVVVGADVLGGAICVVEVDVGDVVVAKGGESLIDGLPVTTENIELIEVDVMTTSSSSLICESVGTADRL